MSLAETKVSVQFLLRHQFDLIYVTAEMNLEGMTREHSLVQPEPDGNCANWLLAHLVQVQNGVMQLVGEAPVWTDPRLPPSGLAPIRGEGEALDWDAMKTAFLGSRERCLDAIERLSDESLAGMLPNPFGGTIMRAELLSILANHQPYHIGQLGLLRRLAGLPGVIKGPGQL